MLEEALEFITKSIKEGKTVLILGTKKQIKDKVQEVAQEVGVPYINERWLGGIISNFGQMKKSLKKMEEMKADMAAGAYAKYTKKERLLLDKEAERLNKYFSGIVSLLKAPDLVFVVDSKKEHIAVAEAQKLKVPVMSLSSTDTDIKGLDYPIIGNDAATSSISYFMSEIAKAFREGRLEK